MNRFSLCLYLLLTGTTFASNTSPSQDTVWVIVRPIQCLGNPWEKEWLSHHPHQDARYPRRQELDLIKKFFSKKQIRILDIRRKPYEGQGLCQACDCSRGDVLYFLVYTEAVSPLVKMGYTERIPASAVPLKTK